MEYINKEFIWGTPMQAFGVKPQTTIINNAVIKIGASLSIHINVYSRNFEEQILITQKFGVV